MKCQNLFSGKNRKIMINLSFASLALPIFELSASDISEKGILAYSFFYYL